MRRGAAVAVVCVASLLGTLVTGCSGGSGAADAPAAATAAPPHTYVAVGASESVGVGADRPPVEAWPRVLYRTALDRNTVFVNMGVEASTVDEALAEQLPLALELRPTLVTVWLNVNDLAAGVPSATYERQLTTLVHALRQDGRARVLVANIPPLEELPAYQALAGAQFPSPDEVTARVAAYNETIERVATAEGAELVDLHAAGVEAVDEGAFAELVSADGFHPSTEGHARIAEIFAAAL
ncbi:MAG: SGNH/GDSL hydrolase family protein [Acidimicrobiales bacterium]